MRSRSPLLVVGAIAVVALGALGIAGLLGRSNPAPVAPVGDASPPAPAASASVAASATPEPSSPSTEASTEPGAAATDGELDGVWSVDPSLGSADDWSASFVGYRVKEELSTLGAIEAVGRTTEVTGTLELAGSAVTAATFTADLSTLKSDDPRRDGQVGRQGLESDRFPEGTFTLTEPIELGAIPVEGGSVTVAASGDLTLHGVTKSVTFPLTAVRTGDEIAVTGALRIAWADFGMTKPRSFVVISLADDLTIELRLRFTRG